MSLDEDINLFSRVELFQNFNGEQLRLLAFGAERITFRDGDTVFHQGDLSNGGYVVVSGQIELKLNDVEQIIDSLGINSLIGELALISSNRRSASAVVKGETELIFISRDLFRRMLGEYPELAGLLQQRIQRNVQSMLYKMTEIQTKMNKIENLS